MRRGLFVLAFVGVMLGFSSLASATHFRFGHITWERVGGPTSRTVRFTITQVYRWNYPGPISIPFAFGDGTSANVVVSTQVRPPVGGAVVEVNQAEDYFVSRNVVEHTYPDAQLYQAGWTQCCRVSDLRNGADRDYNVRARVDLASSAMGSAVSSVPPILRVPQNVGLDYVLPFASPPGSTVSCTLAPAGAPLAGSGLLWQAGQTAMNQPYVSPFDNPASPHIGVSSDCRLKWNTASQPTGKYAVQIKLASGSSDGVLDFIVEVVAGVNRAPVCTGTTQTHTIIAGQPFSTSFVGTDPDGDALRVTHQGLPPGATLTPPSGTMGAQPLNATFDWTPPVSAIGTSYGVTVTYTDAGLLQGNCGFAVTVIDPDTDGDGVNDQDDNCPTTPNPTQDDFDGDDVGDACDPDIDDDGVGNPSDNCQLVPNPDQSDIDGDGQGDLCDGDDDGDLVLDGDDNCAVVPNADQDNTDGDAQGDACDLDDDNDGVPDGDDNCVLVANGDQLDLDGDGQGDACDGDVDGDGVQNDVDNCRIVANSDQTDTDADGEGDSCDGDDDNDGVADATDNCVLTANTNQSDMDGDSLGDVCDDDIDGDGVPNNTDNCELVPNATQSDLDSDGLGDACDDDTDGDGVLNPTDQCPLVAPTADADGDGCPDTAAGLCPLVQQGNLPQGTTQSLCAKANNAASAPNPTAAANILDAFIHEVEAQRGKKIPFSVADLLIEYATNAKANL